MELKSLYCHSVLFCKCSLYSISIKGSFRFCSIQEGLLTENGTWKGGTRRTGKHKNKLLFTLLCLSLIIAIGYSKSYIFFYFFFKVIKDMEAYLDTMSPVIDVMSQLYKDKGLDTDEKV